MFNVQVFFSFSKQTKKIGKLLSLSLTRFCENEIFLDASNMNEIKIDLFFIRLAFHSKCDLISKKKNKKIFSQLHDSLIFKSKKNTQSLLFVDSSVADNIFLLVNETFQYFSSCNR